jgi:hypothetical protein
VVLFSEPELPDLTGPSDSDDCANAAEGSATLARIASAKIDFILLSFETRAQG